MKENEAEIKVYRIEDELE